VSERGGGLFYGWVIVGCALVTLLVTNGITISGMTIFDEALLGEFGWARGSLKFRDLLQFVLAGLLGPLAGALADRFGVKPLMLFGAALLAAILAAYSRVDGLTHMYALHVGIGLVLATCGLVVAILLVSKWFVARRGTALGLTLVGTSLGGVFFPPLVAALVKSLGWRPSFLVLALFPLGLLVVIALFVHDDPARMGLRPLGASEDPGGVKPAASGSGPPPPGPAGVMPGMEYGEALRTVNFWVIALSAMMTFYCILAATAHLFLHLRGLGREPAQAAQGLSLLFTAGLVGKFLFGYLSDMLNKKRVFTGNLAVMFVGSLLLASMRADLILPFLVLFGLGWGGLYTLLQVLTIESFGLRAAGKILGTITVLDALGGGLGPWVTGVLYDRSGSYQSAFALMAGLIFVSFLASFLIQPQRSQGA